MDSANSPVEKTCFGLALGMGWKATFVRENLGVVSFV
jgi:hypothetical protein